MKKVSAAEVKKSKAKKREWLNATSVPFFSTIWRFGPLTNNIQKIWKPQICGSIKEFWKIPWIGRVTKKALQRLAIKNKTTFVIETKKLQLLENFVGNKKRQTVKTDRNR